MCVRVRVHVGAAGFPSETSERDGILQINHILVSTNTFMQRASLGKGVKCERISTHVRGIRTLELIRGLR